MEQAARDLLNEIAELRADRRRIWLEHSRTLRNPAEPPGANPAPNK
jgi:hypothetical protein